MADLTVTRDILATPSELWTLVSDLPRMGEFSPENQGGAWIKGSTGPAVGAQFKGNNQNGSKKWSTTAKVTQCEPGKTFGFRVVVGPVKIADWHYAIADLGDGTTRVTETWTELRPSIFQKLAKGASGVADRKAYNLTSMEETLRRIDETVAKR